MQYWWCSVSKAFLIADRDGSVVDAIDDESYASSVAELAYHRDERLDADFSPLTGGF